MLTFFFLENFHFAVNITTALVIFSMFWLYLDAWQARKTLKDGMKIVGFILLALSYTMHATVVETSLTTHLFSNIALHDIVVRFTRIPGLIFILVGLLTDPVQARPNFALIPDQKKFRKLSLAGFLEICDTHRIYTVIISFITVGALLFVPFIEFLYPVLFVLIGFLYLFRATVGLEHHLKVLAYGFFLMSVSELLHLSVFLQKSLNSGIYGIAVPFGPLWLVSHGVQLVAALVLGRWIFSYLFTRFKSQLFIIFSNFVIIIFLITTFTFTFLLLNNLQGENVRLLETNVKVLQFSLISRQAENLAIAEVVSHNSQIQDGIADDEVDMNETINETFIEKKPTSLIVTNADGQIVARAEDNDRVGDSLSENALVQKALAGQSVSSMIQRKGVLTPEVLIQSAAPVKSEDEVVGVVLVSTVIDNTFVSGIKKTTGLESTLYAGNEIAATTLSGTEGESYVGVREENSEIKDTVLKKGQNYVGTTNIANVPYFGGYVPLKDSNNVPVGMLFVGSPQVTVFQIVGRSIELTFIAAIILIVITMIPIHYISMYIAYQVR